MKKILLAGVAAATMLAAGSAFAADLPSRKYAPVAPVVAAPVFTWTGFYVGVNAGYAWNDSKYSHTFYDAAGYIPLGIGYGASNDDGSFVGGGQVGYNYQIGQFVIGAEADIQYADLSKSAAYFDPAYTLSGKQKLEWFGTVRARLGFVPTERMLVYATGGFAYGGVKTNVYYDDVFGNAIWGGKSDTRTGWTLGGGLEYAFTDNLTAKAEYLYTDLGAKNHNWVSAAASTVGLNVKDDVKFHTVRVGLNYKF